VYRKACKASIDQRLKDAGRTVRVAELVDELSELCVGRCGDANGVRRWNSETEHEFNNLVQEVSRLMCNEELFTFVQHPEVENTNNEAARSLRSAALDRKTGRTTKTLRGGAASHDSGERAGISEAASCRIHFDDCSGRS
jgi:hypothetical protein